MINENPSRADQAEAELEALFELLRSPIAIGDEDMKPSSEELVTSGRFRILRHHATGGTGLWGRVDPNQF